MSEKKNIFELVKEQELSFVLSSRAKEDTVPNYRLNEAAVFIHLFYWESITFYLRYIKNIPVGIDKYVSVSSERMKQRIKEYIKSQNILNCKVIVKENRGRDVSALLVVFRTTMLQYRYACFVHDKRVKDKTIEKETKIWIRSMWDNTLISEVYIHNVLNLLEKNKEIGLLVPPEIAGIMRAYIISWKGNYLNTLDLAKKLNLDCNISMKNPPITHGTVFWCKTAALATLLEAAWKYDDFTNEPMPDDYTISHAVERIFGYVAQSAGYKTGYLISDQFAQSYILQIKSLLYESIFYMEDLEQEIWRNRKKNIIAYMDKYEKVYFYGAGEIGAECYKAVFLERKPCGFIVSQKADKNQKYLELPVYTLDDINADKDTGIVITVGTKYEDEIVQILEKKGIRNYISVTKSDKVENA